VQNKSHPVHDISKPAPAGLFESSANSQKKQPNNRLYISEDPFLSISNTFY